MQYCSLLDIINSYNVTEIKESYLKLLSNLTGTVNIHNDIFLSQITNIISRGEIYICYIYIDGKIKIIGSGTILVEPKIIHGAKNVGHIEDIVVDPEYNGKGIASLILQYLKDEAQNQNCYKIILDCKEELELFYNKNGFVKNGIQCSHYFDI